MKLSDKTYAILVILAFTIPNLFVIYNGKESFPFTHAPMFGHYIGENTNFYDFAFIGEDGNKETKIYPTHVNPRRSNDLFISRFFFNEAYGSVEDKAPFGRFKADSKEAMEQRMERFFPAYFKFLHSDTSPIKKVRLEVSQFTRDYKLKDTHLLGYYDVESKNYVHQWKNNQ
jgi:hypothetical protein